jgi:hypothetical protein
MICYISVSQSTFFSSRSEVFLVGCGALGCEYLTGLALMGLAVTDSVVCLWTSPVVKHIGLGHGCWYHLVPFLVTCLLFWVPWLVKQHLRVQGCEGTRLALLSQVLAVGPGES